MSGLGDKIKGKAEEVAGKLTGDQKLEAKGKTDQIAGNLKDQAEKAIIYLMLPNCTQVVVSGYKKATFRFLTYRFLRAGL